MIPSIIDLPDSLDRLAAYRAKRADEEQELVAGDDNVELEASTALPTSEEYPPSTRP